MIIKISNMEEFRKCDNFWRQIEKYCNIFTKKEWLESWWENYNENKFLRLYVYLDDKDNVIIVLPLMLQIIDGKTVLSQLTDSCSDYYKVLCGDGCDSELLELLRYIYDNEQYDYFRINNLKDNDKNTILLIKSVLKVNCNVELTVSESTYFINMMNSTYKDYFQHKSKNFKHKIRHVHREGENFQFSVINDYNEKIINKIIQIHQAKWKSEFQISVFYDMRRLAFLKSICYKFSKKNILRIFVLFDGNNIIAYRLGFLYNNIYHDWNTSYDVSYSAKSVGILLCDHVIRYCYDQGIEEFDFLRGGEYYKEKFATGKRNLISINVEKMNLEKNNTFISPISPKMNIYNILQDTNGILFDLDGVVYKGKSPISNTIEFINYLLTTQIKVGFLTNTSSRFSRDIHSKLQGMGVDEKDYYIETSSTATAKYLKEKCVSSCVVYGGDGVLASEISDLGIVVYDVSNAPDNVDCVVIGYSQQFEYYALARINELLKNGAELVSTDEDKLFAHNKTNLPGTSWILSSVEHITDKKAFVIGKPNSYSALALLEKMGLKSDEVLVVGDNMDSDILMAKSIQSSSCLLLGGVSDENDIAKAQKKDKPDIVTNDLRKLIPYLERRPIKV